MSAATPGDRDPVPPEIGDYAHAGDAFVREHGRAPTPAEAADVWSSWTGWKALPLGGLLRLSLVVLTDFARGTHPDSLAASSPAPYSVAPRPVDDSTARQLVSDLATIGRHVEDGYSLRIESYRGQPDDTVFAILKWEMTGSAGIIAWKHEVVGRHHTMAGAVRRVVEQTGWT